MAADQLSVDIVVPSMRPHSIDFTSLINIKTPEGVLIHYIFVIDKPGFNASVDFPLLHECPEKVTVVVNQQNIGAAASRNAGLDLSKGDYVLFLDDDVIPDENLLIWYVRAIDKHPEDWGFVGVTKFPQPMNTFTAGVLESDILTFFGISLTRERLSWGTTSNIMLKRSVLKEIRFSVEFPKGGEVIESLTDKKEPSSDDVSCESSRIIGQPNKCTFECTDEAGSRFENFHSGNFKNGVR